MEAIVTLKIKYVPGTTTAGEVKEQLEDAIDFLANNGLLTGEGPAEIDEWSRDVTVQEDGA